MLENKLAFKFGVGAQFIVSKKYFKKKTKEFYSNIVKMLEYSLNPIEGYVIERFHKLILSKCLFKIRENYLNLYFHNIIY
jgi:hypothetical protein